MPLSAACASFAPSQIREVHADGALVCELHVCIRMSVETLVAVSTGAHSKVVHAVRHTLWSLVVAQRARARRQNTPRRTQHPGTDGDLFRVVCERAR
jgi:hypothetical protein